MQQYTNYTAQAVYATHLLIGIRIMYIRVLVRNPSTYCTRRLYIYVFQASLLYIYTRTFLLQHFRHYIVRAIVPCRCLDPSYYVVV